VRLEHWPERDELGRWRVIPPGQIPLFPESLGRVTVGGQVREGDRLEYVEKREGDVIPTRRRRLS
jgi:hypothetical protein